MIYIDPPYNTGNDSFIYPDDFAERKEAYEKRTGQKNDDGFLNKLDLYRKNTPENGRYHSVWLSMMYPRLYLARNLLKEDGVIFVSIDDNEVSNLRLLMDEIFGAENFIAIFPWRKRTAKSDVPYGISQDFEWIISYTKSSFFGGKKIDRNYYYTEDVNKKWRLSDLTKQASKEERPNSFFTLVDPKTKKEYPANPNRVWSVSKDTFEEYYKKGKIVFPDDYAFLNISTPAYRVFEEEDVAKSVKKFGTKQTMSAISTLLPNDVGRSETGNKEIVELFQEKIFSFPKPSSLIKYLINIITDKEAVILDFFAGSGTTAHAVLSANNEDRGKRKFICVQMPEKIEPGTDAYTAGFRYISEITRERIKRVIEKIKKTQKQQLDSDNREQDLGFKSYKLKNSNFKKWKSDIKTEEELMQQIEIFTEPLANKDADSFTLLTELMLKSGIPLSAKVESLESSDGLPFYLVEKEIVFALDKISQKLLDDIETKKPKKLVVLGNLFEGEKADELMTNWRLQLKESNTEFKII